MSIIKNINKIYLSLTTLIIITFITSTVIYVNAYDKSEIGRIKGITTREINNFESKIENLKEDGDSFLEWVSEAEKIHKEYGIKDISGVLNIKEKLAVKGFDSASILDGNKQVISNTEYIKILENEYKEISNKLISFGENKDGFIFTEKEVYYIYFNKLPVEEMDLRVLLIKKIDEEFLNKSEGFANREINMQKNIEKDRMIQVNLESNIEAYLYIGKKEVKSYIPISVDEAGNEIYFTINECKRTTLSLMDFSLNIICIFIVIFCIGNYFIYRTIKNKLVKRILDTNNNVNDIIKSENIELIEVDSHNDEISNLAKDINKLVVNIKENTEKILVKERNNSRLLSAMQNLYIYIELVEDDRGQVVDGIIKEMNNSAMKLFGLCEEELGNCLSYYKEIGKYKHYTEETLKVLNDIKEKGKTTTYKNCKLEEGLYFDININCVNDKCISVILNDVSEINQINDKLEYIANYDDVTGLYSKFYSLNYLTNVINNNEDVFTILLDLDNFKIINDAIGHSKGDKILKILGESLEKLNSDKTIVGRFGGDEFIVVGIGTKEEAENICNEIRRIINRRLKFNNYTYEVKGTIGVSLYPTQGLNTEELIQYADIAMHTGKIEGKNRFKIYNEEMKDAFELQSKLKEAIARGELEAYFQPIYNTLSNEVIGAEALVRWKTIKEVITPDRFLDLAKKNGDIVLIDDFILREACKLCKEKIEEGIKDFYISVNISYKYFILDSFIEIVKEIIRDTDIKPSRLRVEITESELLRDYDNLSKKLEELRDMGIKISLDDFGVGYSAFNYIRKLPIDSIKIDNNLVKELGKDEKNKYIIDMLIKLCRKLNLEVVCEGVELEEQLDILKDINCENIQGYYISEPLSKEKFNELLKCKGGK